MSIRSRAADRSLLQVALDVVMTARGSYERSPEANQRDREILRIALVNWTPSGLKHHTQFDDAVKRLLDVAFWERATDERDFEEMKTK